MQRAKKQPWNKCSYWKEIRSIVVQKADFALLSLWPPFQLILWFKPKDVYDSPPFKRSLIYPHLQISLKRVNISGQIEWPWEGWSWVLLLVKFLPSSPWENDRVAKVDGLGLFYFISFIIGIHYSRGSFNWLQFKWFARLTSVLYSCKRAADPVPLACWMHTAGRLLRASPHSSSST